jgi:hypothetical protein
MNPADEIIYHNDISLLIYIVGEMTEIIGMLEDTEEKKKLLMALYDFEAIHRTRTNDLLKLQRGVEEARQKHRKVVAERNQYKANWKEAERRLNEYIDREMS